MIVRLIAAACFLLPCSAYPQTHTPAPPSVLLRVKHTGNLNDFYPSEAQRKGLEGLVYVLLDVDPKGVPTNISISEEGFNTDIFGPTVTRWARKSLRFEPPTRNGEPVEVKGITIPVRFAIKMHPGVTRDFRAEIQKVVSLLQEKDFAGAHFHAQWMLAEKVQLNYEYAVLQATLANTYSRVQRPFSALAAVRRVTRPVSMRTDPYVVGLPLPEISERDFLLPAENVRQLLKLQYMLAASQGLTVEAVTSLAYLRALGGLDDADPANAQFYVLLNQVTNAQILNATVHMEEQSTWRHDLHFRYFAIRDVRGGSISQFSHNCGRDGTTVLDESSIGSVVAVPEDGDACALNIDASPGTTFRIVEYREAPTATPQDR